MLLGIDTIAQTYPAKPVRLIVPSSPGGGTDTSSRFIAPKLSELLGQQIVVENRPGASTLIGLEAAAKSVPGYEATQWFGLLAPPGTPREIVGRLHAEIGRTLKDPGVRKRFTSDGSDVAASASPEEFAAYIRADEEKWAKVAKAAGLKPE